jgi:hypothetical protein
MVVASEPLTSTGTLQRKSIHDTSLIDSGVLEIKLVTIVSRLGSIGYEVDIRHALFESGDF